MSKKKPTKKPISYPGFSELLDRIGGLQVLAFGLGVTENAARHWAVRGVPDKYWLAIADLLLVSDKALADEIFALFSLNESIRQNNANKQQQRRSARN